MSVGSKKRRNLSTSSPKAKGNALEYAVHCIVEAMHRSIPGLKESNPVIERNKIITKDGVSHEIDLWVRVNPDTLYETHHIIECKNWKKPVGTDEVHKLAGKMKALSVAKGTIIARRFTSDAVALASKERSLTLHHVAADFWSPLKTLIGSGITYDIDHTRVTLHFRTPSPDNPATIDQTRIMYRAGVAIGSLQSFANWLIHQHMRSVQEADGRNLPEGVSRKNTRIDRTFEPGECVVDDHEISQLEINVDYTATIVRGKIVTKFDVEHRGGFVRIEFPTGTFGQKDVALEIVTKRSNGP